MLLGGRLRCTEGGRYAVRLRGGRQIDRRLRQPQLSFRTAEKVVGVLGGEGDGERPRIGEPDILDRHAHQAAREVERIFSSREHAREPIQRAIDIGAAHGFVERGDQVVVLLPGFVVDRKRLFEYLSHHFWGSGTRDGGGGRGGRVDVLEQGFERIEGTSRVSLRVRDQQIHRVVAQYPSLLPLPCSP